MITFLIVIILVVIVLPIWLLIRMLRLSGRALHWLRTRPKFPSHRSQQAWEEPDPKLVSRVAKIFSIITDRHGWNGWQVVGRDASYQYSLLDIHSDCSDLRSLSNQGLLRGEPGLGLEEASEFDERQIRAGEKGETILARAILGEHPPFLSWWSLYGFDEYGRLTVSDIDCVLLGMRPNGRMVAWFIDAKCYKGGADTVYAQLGEWHLVRVSRIRRAFVADSTGKPWLTMSPNMWEQRERWAPLLKQYGIESYWMVCVTPPGDYGTPDMSAVTWPGGIATTDIPILRTMVYSQCSPGMLAYIPPAVIALFDNHLKR